MKRAPIVALALSLGAACALAAQEPVPPPRDTTRRDSVVVDTARVDSAAVDTAQVPADTLAPADTVPQDTLPPVPVRRLRVQPAYRRTPHFGLDPFRNVVVPHWGLVTGVGASAANNAVNSTDIGALMLLEDNDSLTAETGIDALGLVPRGTGLLGLVQAGGSLHLGGPFGGHFGLGFSAQGHAYGSFHLADDAVALLRDGNGERQDFSLGHSRGAALATAEGGVHAVLRFGATGNEPGLRVIVGLGARYLKPLAYGRGGSDVTDTGTIRVTGDSIALNVRVESQYTYQSEDDPMGLTGSGLAKDFMLRLELPWTGLSLEAVLANVGDITIQGVERRRLSIDNVRAASIKELRDVLMHRDTSFANRVPGPGVDTTVEWKLRPEYDFQVRDTTEVTVTLPRLLRLAASAWVLPMLQLDAAYTAEVTGEIVMPRILEAGATLRLIRWFPLRVGIIDAGDYGRGLTGGFGLETRVLYITATGATYGGSFRTARGAGGRVEFGLFF